MRSRDCRSQHALATQSYGDLPQGYQAAGQAWIWGPRDDRSEDRHTLHNWFSLPLGWSAGPADKTRADLRTKALLAFGTHGGCVAYFAYTTAWHANSMLLQLGTTYFDWRNWVNRPESRMCLRRTCTAWQSNLNFSICALWHNG